MQAFTEDIFYLIAWCALKGAWNQHIEALHPGRADSHPGQLLGKMQRLQLRDDEHKQLDAEWLCLLWQHSFHHSNPQVSRQQQTGLT